MIKMIDSVLRGFSLAADHSEGIKSRATKPSHSTQLGGAPPDAHR